MTTEIPITQGRIARPTTLFCDPHHILHVSECERVASAVSEAYHISLPRLLSRTNSHKISHPRQVAHYLLSEMGLGASMVGHYFRCHRANIYHSRQAVSDRVSVDANERAKVEQIKQRLGVA